MSPTYTRRRGGDRGGRLTRPRRRRRCPRTRRITPPAVGERAARPRRAIDAERVHDDGELHAPAGALEQRARRRRATRRTPRSRCARCGRRASRSSRAGRPSGCRRSCRARIIAPVVIMLSISFVAVPALRRVIPVTTSGPVTATIGDVDVLQRLRRRRRAGDDRRARADRARVVERAAHVGRGARRGDADDHVARRARRARRRSSARRGPGRPRRLPARS